jgi:phage terminase large subunit GpA-like protein
VHGRNEALDLTVYAHGGLFVLQNFIDPVTFRNLDRLQQMVMHSGSQGSQVSLHAKQPPGSGHRILSEGIKI